MERRLAGRAENLRGDKGKEVTAAWQVSRESAQWQGAMAERQGFPEGRRSAGSGGHRLWRTLEVARCRASADGVSGRA